MIEMNKFGAELDKHGFNFYSGVPCSFLKSMINYAINEQQFIMSANEGDAVATCAGAQIGGKKTIFLCQNSGLTNAVSPLTSLNYTFKIPVLVFVSLRGEEGIKDEPQHELMGEITTDLLNVMKIQNEILSNDIDEAKEQLTKANQVIENGESFFFVVKKNTFDSIDLKKEETELETELEVLESIENNEYPTRLSTLETIQNVADEDTVLLATTGVTGRELYELADKPNQLYMVGSMGCVSALGLGLALARPDKKVIVIDGDGAFFMRMGSITTNAYYAPENLLHILLDNESHGSTGGQFTVSSNVDFTQIVEGAGYNRVEAIHTLDELTTAINQWEDHQRLTFAYLKISKGKKKNLGRPKETPEYIKNRFIDFINSSR